MPQEAECKVGCRTIRAVNRSIVLDIVRRSGRVSRADLVQRSALTKPTISAIVEELVACGILHELGYGIADTGRRAQLYEFNDASAAYLGIRCDVHTITVGVADGRGTLRAQRALPSPRGDARATVAAALSVVDRVCKDAGVQRDRLQAAGVTVPGLVDDTTGVVALAPNLEWRNTPVRELFEAALRIPIAVNNVANAGAIAEGRAGVAKYARSYAWVHVDSGVGAGIVVEGRVFPGSHGSSGEIGHCSLVAGGVRCNCGKRGCLETLASGPAIARMAREAVATHEATSLSPLAEINASDVAREARAGDAVSQRIFKEAGRHLGSAISCLVNILDPEMIVLGGGVVREGNPLLEDVRSVVAQCSPTGSSIPIVLSTLGDQAGLVGAVFAALDSIVPSYRVVTTGVRTAAPLEMRELQDRVELSLHPS